MDLNVFLNCLNAMLFYVLIFILPSSKKYGQM